MDFWYVVWSNRFAPILSALLNNPEILTECSILLMYEQKNKSINKAQAITLMKISRALNCDVEDLLEMAYTT